MGTSLPSDVWACTGRLEGWALKSEAGSRGGLSTHKPGGGCGPSVARARGWAVSLHSVWGPLRGHVRAFEKRSSCSEIGRLPESKEAGLACLV